ncbi:uncharacterized protein LACBIDRAFT_309769 [Laccaria bicolor S238N-H82]|uniref:Predicted protein n=1 Tax=Laccaria bicolor (strain S238N-H82 / ATCC MYA-4686) TaxID=486041 RepID=B0DT17_LACBS|nr:uncharacterized protein LACBIDRAFT_309769 [Laccaria bicolor S238N-H82]EDR02335.1 predicted protein [Laccaria bicolor S238N-H82]|eukprot:XP_001887012.1 predicted protein [Laccaria bicolor S238N-H82]
MATPHDLFTIHLLFLGSSILLGGLLRGYTILSKSSLPSGPLVNLGSDTTLSGSNVWNLGLTMGSRFQCPSFPKQILDAIDLGYHFRKPDSRRLRLPGIYVHKARADVQQLWYARRLNRGDV